jgi:hypothetical protein
MNEKKENQKCFELTLTQVELHDVIITFRQPMVLPIYKEGPESFFTKLFAKPGEYIDPDGSDESVADDNLWVYFTAEENMLHEIQGLVTWLYMGYVLADDSDLTWDALQMKQRLQREFIVTPKA